MKTGLLLLLVFSASLVYAQRDTCTTFGHCNARRGMMRVTGPFSCADTNFTACSRRSMPYGCMMNDTVWVDLCLRAHDGCMHRTTVSYGTDAGTQSFEVEMVAPQQSYVRPNTQQRIAITLTPNPTMDRVTVRLGAPVASAHLEVIDRKGVVYMKTPIMTDTEISLTTIGLPIGNYTIVLRSNGAILATQDLIVLR